MSNRFAALKNTENPFKSGSKFTRKTVKNSNRENSFGVFKNVKVSRSLEKELDNKDLFPSLSKNSENSENSEKKKCEMDFSEKLRIQKKRRIKNRDFIPPGWIGLRYDKSCGDIIVTDRSRYVDESFDDRVERGLNDMIQRWNSEIQREVELYGDEYFYVYPGDETKSCHHNHFLDFY